MCGEQRRPRAPRGQAKRTYALGGREGSTLGCEEEGGECWEVGKVCACHRRGVEISGYACTQCVCVSTYHAILSCGAPLLIAFRSVLCSGCFVLIIGVLAITLLPGIPGVSGLVVVNTP